MAASCLVAWLAAQLGPPADLHSYMTACRKTKESVVTVTATAKVITGTQVEAVSVAAEISRALAQAPSQALAQVLAEAEAEAEAVTRQHC